MDDSPPPPPEVNSLAPRAAPNIHVVGVPSDEMGKVLIGFQFDFFFR
jgi:hypothetical protein